MQEQRGAEGGQGSDKATDLGALALQVSARSFALHLSASTYLPMHESVTWPATIHVRLSVRIHMRISIRVGHVPLSVCIGVQVGHTRPNPSRIIPESIIGLPLDDEPHRDPAGREPPHPRTLNPGDSEEPGPVKSPRQARAWGSEEPETVKSLGHQEPETVKSPRQ